YIPSKNAFIAVNSINENVWIYKLSKSDGINLLRDAQPNVHEVDTSGL
ncbi:hypothetical protein LCGC14_2061520, partial [marine sediment metagenome]